MKFLKIIFSLAFFSLFYLPVYTFGQAKYIKTFKPIADSLSQYYGIPAALILGVSILESGAGSSRNAILLHNHFGIIGKNNLQKTNGIKSRYKFYTNPKDSYVYFARLLTSKKYYKKLKGNMNYKLWVDALSKSGYSEMPLVWKQRILSTIKKNKLYSIL